MGDEKVCAYYGSEAGCKDRLCQYSHADPNNGTVCKQFKKTKDCKFGSKCCYRHFAWERNRKGRWAKTIRVHEESYKPTAGIMFFKPRKVRGKVKKTKLEDLKPLPEPEEEEEEEGETAEGKETAEKEIEKETIVEKEKEIVEEEESDSEETKPVAIPKVFNVHTLLNPDLVPKLEKDEDIKEKKQIHTKQLKNSDWEVVVKTNKPIESDWEIVTNSDVQEILAESGGTQRKRKSNSNEPTAKRQKIETK